MHDVFHNIGVQQRGLLGEGGIQQAAAELGFQLEDEALAHLTEGKREFPGGPHLVEPLEGERRPLCQDFPGRARRFEVALRGGVTAL